MKNLLSILAITAFLFIGNQDVNAQTLTSNNDRPEAIAKTKIADLDKSLDLTDTQERTLFRAFVQREVNYSRYVNNPEIDAVSAKANKAKYDNAFDAAMKKTLTEAQYSKWVSMQ